jgi:hypothetical protein
MLSKKSENINIVRKVLGPLKSHFVEFYELSLVLGLECNVSAREPGAANRAVT